MWTLMTPRLRSEPNDSSGGRTESDEDSKRDILMLARMQLFKQVLELEGNAVAQLRSGHLLLSTAPAKPRHGVGDTVAPSCDP